MTRGDTRSAWVCPADGESRCTREARSGARCARTVRTLGREEGKGEEMRVAMCAVQTYDQSQMIFSFFSTQRPALAQLDVFDSE